MTRNSRNDRAERELVDGANQRLNIANSPRSRWPKEFSSRPHAGGTFKSRPVIAKTIVLDLRD